MQRSPRVWVLGLALAACSHDVPEHEVTVSSDCNGSWESGRFRFEATDYEMSCSGGLLSGSCSSNAPEGAKLSGDLDVLQFVLDGLEDVGPTRYELTLPGPARTDSASVPPPFRHPWCGWYVTPELELEGEAHQMCYYGSGPCSAELSIDL